MTTEDVEEEVGGKGEKVPFPFVSVFFSGKDPFRIASRPGGVPLPKVPNFQNSNDGTFGTPDRKRWYFWNF